MSPFASPRPAVRPLPLLAAASALLLAGCNGDKSTAPTQFAQVRLVNASSNTPSANVFLGSQVLASTLTFGGSSASCVKVPAGATQVLTFRPTSGSSTIATVSQNYLVDGNYTVTLLGGGTVHTALALNDLYTAPTAGNAAIRFMNATATAGSVHATPAATTTLTAATMVPGAENLASNSATSGGFLSVPLTSNRIRFTDVGVFTGTPRADINPLTLPSTRVTTVVFTDPGSPAGPTYFMVSPCR